MISKGTCEALLPFLFITCSLSDWRTTLVFLLQGQPLLTEFRANPSIVWRQRKLEISWFNWRKWAATIRGASFSCQNFPWVRMSCSKQVSLDTLEKITDELNLKVWIKLSVSSSLWAWDHMGQQFSFLSYRKPFSRKWATQSEPADSHSAVPVCKASTLRQRCPIFGLPIKGWLR